MQLYTKILIGMAVGVVLGFLLGPNSSLLSHDGVKLTPNASIHAQASSSAPAAPWSDGIKTGRILERKGGADGAAEWLHVEWKLKPTDLIRFEKAKQEAAKEAAKAKKAEKADAADKDAPKKAADKDAPKKAADKDAPKKAADKDATDDKKPHVKKGPEAGSLQTGWVQNDDSVSTFALLGQNLVDWTEWLGRLFLALIKMVVVPLVFFSLTVGVASIGDFRRLGRMGARTLGLFMATTVLALVVGVGLANVIKPGTLMSVEDRARLLSSYEGGASETVGQAADAPTLTDQVIAIVPSNPVASLSSGDMLQIIFFAVMFGIALTLLDERRSKPVVSLVDNCNEAMVMLVHIAMKLAPVGVATLLFKVVGSTGLSVLVALSIYGVVVIAGLFVHLMVTYGLIVRLGAKLPYLEFLKAIRPAIMVAFSTSSSSATLPVTKECAEDNMNVSPAISSFVVPLGATINMDGTALYQGVAALFIAQIYGMDLTVGDQLTIVTSATLASVGAAGVPGAGMITLAMVLTAIGVPTEGLALVLGVDRLLDMFRTATNVVGDSAATVFMARLEGDDLRFLSKDADKSSPQKGFEKRLDREQHHVEPEVKEDEE